MLKQAIIDANALREVALKNAEAIVVGKYSNQIKEAVDNMLEQEEEEFGEEEMDLGVEDPGLEDPGLEDPAAPESDIEKQAPFAVLDGEKLCPCPDEEDTIKVDFKDLQKILGDLGDEEGEPLPGPSPDEVLPPVAALQEDEDIEFDLSELLAEEELPGPGYDDLAPSPGENDVSDHALNVDLSSLESEDSSMEEGAMYSRDDDEDLDEDLGKIDPMKDASYMKPTGADAPDPTVIEKLGNELMGMTSKDPGFTEKFKKFQDGVNTLTKGKLDHPLIVLRSQVLQKAYDLPLQESQRKNKKILKENATFNKENKSLKGRQKQILTENKEMKDLLQKLSNTLGEVNLSNAKLVYTNRVLTSNSLNERQKQRIAEAINGADSVDAAKSIYETLQSAVGSSLQSETGPKSLGEAITRGSATMLRQQQKKRTQDPFMHRMKKLAGI